VRGTGRGKPSLIEPQTGEHQRKTTEKPNNALKRTRRKASNEDIQLKFYLKSRFPHSQGKNGGTGRTEHDKPPKKKNQDLQESQPMEEKKHVKRKRSVKERMN